MLHTPLSLDKIALSFPHKTCFEGFSTHIHFGRRIGLIGRNGSGKSSLLKMLTCEISASSGSIHIPSDAHIAYVPQIIAMDNLSGGERFQKALTAALETNLNILLLDEPTNHLDAHHRKALLRMLKHYAGTLIIATHDVQLLNECVDTLWHVDQKKITIFKGNYADYTHRLDSERNALLKKETSLTLESKATHAALMQEQERASKSRSQGKKNIVQRKWPTVVSTAKASRASKTTGSRQKDISDQRNTIRERLESLSAYEVITPTFTLSAADQNDREILAIWGGSCGYGARIILPDIHLRLCGGERLAIKGANGSGKTTLIRAILNDSLITRAGEWYTPCPSDIGYLDQHYSDLDPSQSVLETIHAFVPRLSHAEVRRHLNDFLFRKNAEVNASVSTLSGGEKARLSLSKIAAKPPKLLILDEITNNIDTETRTHIVQILKHYPGAMIIISHDDSFLKAIDTDDIYQI